MKRVEYKIKEVDRAWIETVLLDNGAVKVFEGDLITTYFNRKDDDFMASGRRLSLRYKANKSVLTFKDKYNDVGVGVADEFSVEVSDPHLMKGILAGMGFISFKTFRKYRYDYQIGETTFSFDKYQDDFEYVPEFMMIEAESKEEVVKWAQKFNHNESECEIISVLELIQLYKNL